MVSGGNCPNTTFIDVHKSAALQSAPSIRPYDPAKYNHSIMVKDNNNNGNHTDKHCVTSQNSHWGKTLKQQTLRSRCMSRCMENANAVATNGKHLQHVENNKITNITINQHCNHHTHSPRCVLCDEDVQPGCLFAFSRFQSPNRECMQPHWEHPHEHAPSANQFVNNNKTITALKFITSLTPGKCLAME
jgi:hypothetical protein